MIHHKPGRTPDPNAPFIPHDPKSYDFTGVYGSPPKKNKYIQEVNSSDEDTAQASSSSAPAAKAGAKQSKQQIPSKASKTQLLSELAKASMNGVLQGTVLAAYNAKMVAHGYHGTLGKGKSFQLNHFDVEDLRTFYRVHVYGTKPP